MTQVDRRHITLLESELNEIVDHIFRINEELADLCGLGELIFAACGDNGSVISGDAIRYMSTCIQGHHDVIDSEMTTIHSKIHQCRQLAIASGTWPAKHDTPSVG